VEVYFENCRGLGCNDVGQIEYVHDRDRGRSFMNTALKFSGSIKGERREFLD